MKGHYPMNKNDLIEYIIKKSDAELSKTLVNKILDLTFEGIESTLKKGGEVKFVGFGTFKTSKRKATTGRNPQTGEAIKIAASTRVKFSAGKELKEAVN